MKRKFMALCMTGVALFAAACNGNADGSSGKPANAEVKVWTAYGTEKIMQDKTYDSTDSTLVIKAFKNEYESGQIIMTPNYDVQEYTITLSDLTCGANKLKKENFTVYNQKYIRVSTVKDTSPLLGAVVGYYPDALLPMDAAIEYDENKIVANENQGIWLTLKVPKDQAAGVYTGNFQVDVDGTVKTVPVEITVYDYAITDESHTKSTYAVYINELAQGEQERTLEMEKAYVDFLLDYRMSPQQLPTTHGLHSTNIEAFLDAAVEYTNNVKCSYFNIPYATVSMNFEDAKIYKYQNVIDINFYEETLTAMLARSLKEGVNLFSKAGSYMLFADEAAANNKIESTVYSAKAMKAKQESLASAWTQLLDSNSLASTLNVEVSFDKDFAKDCIEEMRTLKNLMTGKIYEGDPFDEPVSYVPVIDEIHEESERLRYEEIMDQFEEVYNEEGELWLYHALNPKSPYPTVHIEDHLITSRMMGWMMYNYNYVGSLYWDVTLYAWRSDHWNNLDLQDYYGTALRFPEANGDGFLVYPGKPYDVYGPVGSVRLHGYRDGMEDYEILYQLEQEYKRVASEQGVEYDGKAFEELMEMLTIRLYKGTQTKLNAQIDDTFMETRELMAKLLDLVSKTDTTIEEFSMEDGVANVKLSTATGAEVKINGETKTGTPSANERTVYSFTQYLTQDSNYFNLSVIPTGGTTETVKFYLSGKFVTYDMSNFVSNFTVLNGGSGALDTVEGMNVYKANITAGTANTGANPSGVSLNVSAMSLNSKKKSITLNLYNYGEEVTVTLMAQRSGTLVTIGTLTLKTGMNKVNYALSIASGSYPTLYFLTDGKAATIGVGNIIVEG